MEFYGLLPDSLACDCVRYITLTSLGCHNKKSKTVKHIG